MPRSKARTDFLASVLCTAVEGGIDYWADILAYSHDEDEEGQFTSAHARLRQDGGPATTEVDLTLDVIELGISRVRSTGFKIAPRMLGEIATGDLEDDASIIDADEADVIVQAGLFEEIIFG